MSWNRIYWNFDQMPFVNTAQLFVEKVGTKKLNFLKIVMSGANECILSITTISIYLGAHAKQKYQRVP